MIRREQVAGRLALNAPLATAVLTDFIRDAVETTGTAGVVAPAFKAAPRFAPRRRLDETLAARKPVLRWRPSNNFKQAAE